MSQPAPPATYREFWDYYVTQHRNRNCRRAHFIGSSLGLTMLVPAIALANPWFVLLGLALGYGGAWYGHFVFEKNKPASWRSPKFAVWSFASDWIMWGKMLSGSMDREVARIEEQHGLAA